MNFKRGGASPFLRMKKPGRITKFTIERERTYIFRNSDRQEERWCETCDMEVPMMTVAEAGREFGLSELAIYQLLDQGGIHFIENAEGRLFICLNSLRTLKQTESEKDDDPQGE
jgi:hypothetical protein